MDKLWFIYKSLKLYEDKHNIPHTDGAQRRTVNTVSLCPVDECKYVYSYVSRLLNQGSHILSGLLQSVGWDYKPRSRHHMALAVGGTLNHNQPNMSLSLIIHIVFTVGANVDHI